MQLSIFSLAAVGLAAAHTTMDETDQDDAAAGGLPDLSKIPACAMTCLTQSISSSPCVVTDVECQCTTGAEAIAAALIPCICQSTCKPEELATALSISTGICKSALEAKGKTFDAPPVSPDMCSKMAAGAPGAASPAQAPGAGAAAPAPAPAPPAAAPGHATPPSPPTSYGYGHTATNVTKNATGTTPPIQQSTGAAASLGVDTQMLVSAAFLGLVGVGLMAL